MPEISRFFGIVVAMYYSDHAPPHFHVRYGAQKARFAIDDVRMLDGNLGPRARGLVVSGRRRTRMSFARNGRTHGSRSRCSRSPRWSR